eukprot:TRINITY_DN2278_c0_g1_i3.p1 TRINITY_DN2278_c0_g1~~TRINITY_DN2278_c0_g1_i3.p1  ORF type:complete len:482 (+),score=56.32 TRINITY_DN2278_c0_g1_i3:70-1515(+)
MPSDPIGENIKVITRFRPMLKKESGEEFAEISPDGKRVEVESDCTRLGFDFDKVLGASSGQDDVYEASATEVIGSVLNGYNGAVIAYGQTGSGKTHTMMGTEEAPGLVPRCTSELFYTIQRRMQTTSDEFLLSCSYVQIYKEQILDMLDDGRRCHVTEGSRDVDTMMLNCVSNIPVDSYQEMTRLIKLGNKNRIVHETKMNDASSRSHAVFLITVVCKSKEGVSTVEKIAQLYLVDLAGSECIAKTESKGETLEEAKAINVSLLALRRVIMSLLKKEPHIPYRDSILTRVLRNALGGNSRTTILICCSPSTYNKRETISSLRFGVYTGSITNVAVRQVVHSTDDLEKILADLYAEVEAATNKKRQLENEVRVYQETISNVPAQTPRGTISHGMPIDPSDIPGDFKCPISGSIMNDPVVLSDGHSYQRSSAESLLARNGGVPPNHCKDVPPRFRGLILPNLCLQQQIHDFKQSYYRRMMNQL